jgi:hypothetical protein
MRSLSEIPFRRHPKIWKSADAWAAWVDVLQIFGWRRNWREESKLTTTLIVVLWPRRWRVWLFEVEQKLAHDWCFWTGQVRSLSCPCLADLGKKVQHLIDSSDAILTFQLNCCSVRQTESIFDSIIFVASYAERSQLAAIKSPVGTAIITI